MVQASHAAREAGIYFPTKTVCSLIVCEANSESELHVISDYLRFSGIQFIEFREPDMPSDHKNGQLTALGTESVDRSLKKKLRKLTLWKAGGSMPSG